MNDPLTSLVKRPKKFLALFPRVTFKMKFGKQIQRRQLDLPEYAASFVNYKALKKLIKHLSATPTIAAQGAPPADLDPQSALRANKEVFFFRLEREIEKVNEFYVQKESEFSTRLKTLLDKKRVVQSRTHADKKAPTYFVSLFEGFLQFDSDLNKLQQFVEINETAVSKILKKSRMKELYLQRAVEVQPCFNREVLRDLSDRATTVRLDLEAWAEGENIRFDVARATERAETALKDEDEQTDLQVLHMAAAGNMIALQEWITKLRTTPDSRDRITRLFLSAVTDFSDEILGAILESGLVDLHAEDDINGRNCLHEAAISGRTYVFEAGLKNGVDITRPDVYGRIPLHYACIHGRVEMVRKLLSAAPDTVNSLDHDNFTPLIHSIVRNRLECAEQLLNNQARIDPTSESDHIPLNLACQHGTVAIAKVLLQKGASLLPDAEGLYPQHLVARSGKAPELLTLLKEHGADLNQNDKLYQWTPLFHAASEGCVACLRSLLELGVDTTILDEKGLSAMYYAAWEGHLECMALLWSKRDPSLPHRPLISHQVVPQTSGATTGYDGFRTDTGPSAFSSEGPDGIPDLELPPPIIPLRRYGHNFLDTKAFVQIYFDTSNRGPIVFDRSGRHPASRLTMSSKLSDVIPRTIMLPIQEDSRIVTFQVDTLENFVIEFEIFPTFGSKVIAKTVALPSLFSAENSSAGSCSLPLFDPRLRSIGQIRFDFQVIKPYYGDPLEITHFATYWKATNAIDADHNGLITGSSLSGDYVQLFVQLTKDRKPVLHPLFSINHFGIDIPICTITYEQFQRVARERGIDTNAVLESLHSKTPSDIASIHKQLANSFLSLQDVLSHLPTSINVNLTVIYPPASEEKKLSLSSLADINTFGDCILHVVFDHARASRQKSPDFMRSVVFTSYNTSICTALNWKQPNYPVLLCNDLGQIGDFTREVSPSAAIPSDGHTSMSIKEAARIAQSNNFMGLICRSTLLNVMPALIETIKEQGLVLIADTSDETSTPPSKTTSLKSATEWAYRTPEGVNGVMKATGVLRFNESIDM
ncbi:cyclin dependent kinase inhibitor Pho81, putative [Talaromyces stipitatus ATCC 10500]|uniref:Cyclin dependent kinase inhibitor Pho81, putative n=1 Tax=Talaromyces stipitatus (strain ATCC 10500 / CBS 375.48 / QM 6759 / NRRL 1006) TaxID=441959 RepID=B8LTQ8_TALSN|nr:cyclin dependent kinase inhibitor Pho81, putative [Talaromyces stipitatus ATCC 10500]EED23650.1 cyclin dependent kinase inhibitor Pho81, putative [Talaromyces stipitatus ATCC 10500]